MEISSLNILIDSCKNLKKSLLKNNSSRKWIENQNINFNKLENYLSPQARKIPQTNEANTNYTLYPFAIQNQVYKNDFLLLSTYYNCK
ncbi:hypothetical protein [Silvanigrella sp.]|uniref:hypothetical protein n=1 Tax=Silvanigrella sp. TaxID=2024976 RepID=UPI0037C9ADA9